MRRAIDWRAYTSARRAAAQLAGKCGECAVRFPRPGASTCDVCLLRRAARKERQKRAVLHAFLDLFCIDCQAYGFHRENHQ